MWCVTPLCFTVNDAATTEIYTLSLHDALPISVARRQAAAQPVRRRVGSGARRLRRARIGLVRRRAAHHHRGRGLADRDRKSTRLNSSHGSISYAVFCLKKKK